MSCYGQIRVDSTRTLVLSSGYEPIQVVSWQRAITLLALDKVDIVAQYDAVVRAVSIVMQVPSIVRHRSAAKRRPTTVKFSRSNIYARDDYRCQYCGIACTVDELTYDHVIPRSHGGRTTWENIVSCCYACNRRKANRTPAEAGMTLLAVPKRPTWVRSIAIRADTSAIPDAWRDYVN
jgi:5-methylcytosine-specific restriction endonuclease McrA